MIYRFVIILVVFFLANTSIVKSQDNIYVLYKQSKNDIKNRQFKEAISLLIELYDKYKVRHDKIELLLSYCYAEEGHKYFSEQYYRKVVKSNLNDSLFILYDFVGDYIDSPHRTLDQFDRKQYRGIRSFTFSSEDDQYNLKKNEFLEQQERLVDYYGVEINTNKLLQEIIDKPYGNKKLTPEQFNDLMDKTYY